MITLIDEDTQHIIFKHEFAFDKTTREDAFCNHVISQNNVIVVPDAMKDSRFLDNPLVTGNPHIRFYAGASLTTQDGHNLGSLCVIDQRPAELTNIQQQMLAALSKQVIQLLEFDASLNILKDQYLQARRSEAEMRAFFETSIDCHLLLGRDFEIIAFNKAWDNHVKSSYNLNMTPGESMRPYLHPKNVNMVYNDFYKALTGTPVLSQQKVSNGSQEFWRITRYEPAFNNEGQIFGVSINSTDITSEVEQREIVGLQNKSLKEIAWIQSHEVRRPVATILGLMDLLRLDGHVERIQELQLMEQAAIELDDKIRLIVNHTTS
ncbi:MAG: GAF domain-containing protein [Flavobacterium sp.]|nr:MAG: GAF domain-containing protein [Flavobacterium sp.]